MEQKGKKAIVLFCEFEEWLRKPSHCDVGPYWAHQIMNLTEEREKNCDVVYLKVISKTTWTKEIFVQLTLNNWISDIVFFFLKGSSVAFRDDVLKFELKICIWGEI